VIVPARLKEGTTVLPGVYVPEGVGVAVAELVGLLLPPQFTKNTDEKPKQQNIKAK